MSAGYIYIQQGTTARRVHRLPGREHRHTRLTRTDPKAARSPKLALPRAEGQEQRRCTMTRTQTAEAPAAAQPGYSIRKHDRNWKVMDPAGQLVCITLYKKGAKEVVRRLEHVA
jgi:hypothetical protein